MIETLKRLAVYMHGRKALLPLSLLLSALNGCLALVPFILIWMIIRILLSQGGDLSHAPIQGYAWGALAVSIVSILLYFCALMASHLSAFRVEISMRERAMEKLMKVPLGFFLNQSTGRMRKIIDEDPVMMHTYVAHILPDFAASIVSPLTVIVLLFVVNWKLGLAAMCPILGAFFIMGTMMDPRKNKFQALYLDAQEQMSSEAVEYIRGIPVLKVFQQTIFSFKRFYDSILNYRDLVTKCTQYWRNPMSLYVTVINSFAFVLVPVAIILIANGQNPMTTLADMLLFVIITPVISKNVMRIMYLYEQLFLAKESLDRLENLLEASPLPEPETSQKIDGFDIRLENVSFRYEGAETDTLHEINLTIPSGETTALVGPSGSGKTTIARLIPRFWDVSAGCVSIGGVDIRRMSSEELMRNISFVFQHTRLFKMSLLDNIRYGTPEATIEQINRAIDLSQSREIVDRLPQGLDTLIGSEGTYLSGGEQQRIVLARAILKNAPIVILDEATAYADPENEYLIRQALAHLTRGKTVLMIAHRLTTVQDAGNIVVVNDGRIDEQGTHQELIDKHGMYYHMWNEYRKAITWKL